MYSKQDFREFLKTQRADTKWSKESIYLDALTQFDQLPQDYLGMKQTTVSYNTRTHFILEGKPVKVPVRTFLLYKFGYRECKICDEIVSIEDFYTNNKVWNKLSNYCVNCTLANQSEVDKEAKAAYGKKRYKEMPEYHKIKSNKYRASKLERTPPWLNKSHQQQFLEIERSRLPGEETDHIVPLQGKYVSGLHVPWNLQNIPKEENRSKGNYHESEEYWKN